MTGADKIMVLEIHPSYQVKKEKTYKIINNLINIGGKQFILSSRNIMYRKDQPYAIYLTGLGFVIIDNISNSLM